MYIIYIHTHTLRQNGMFHSPTSNVHKTTQVHIFFNLQFSLVLFQESDVLLPRPHVVHTRNKRCCPSGPPETNAEYP